MATGHASRGNQQARAATTARALLVYPALALVILCMLLTVPMARADESAMADAAPDTTVSAVTTETGLISLGTDVSHADLDENRAKAMLEIDKVFINDQELNGTVSGNTAINSNNGANSIAGTAFSGASGFVNTIQNTGNNVLIQSATIVNVSIED